MRELEITKKGWSVNEIKDHFSNYYEENPIDAQGVKADIDFDTESEKCKKHECQLMYDDMNEFYYCPLCEK